MGQVPCLVIEGKAAMDVVMSLVRAALTLGVIAAVIILIAVFFIVVFTLGTGIDKHLNQ